MAPASNEEQFKFLISCIRYSNNGKVDFGQVAAECKIVSKGAAAKRYERMMRAHGIAANPATVKQNPSRNTKSEARDFGAISKKRKNDQFLEQYSNADDEESFVKQDPMKKDTKEHLRVKDEERGQLSMEEAANLMRYYDNSPHTSSTSEYKYESGGSDRYGGLSSMGGPSESWNINSYTQPYASEDIKSVVQTSSPTSSGRLYSAPIQHSMEGGGIETPLIVE